MIREDAERISRELFAAYPATPLREETPSVYVQYLTRIALDDVSPLVPELVETMPNLPTIADIRRRIVERRLALPHPLEAYHSLFDRGAERHPLTQYVAEIFGGVFNIRTADAPGAARSQFVGFYGELREETLRLGELPRVVAEAAERADRVEEEAEDAPSIWSPIRRRFDALESDERERRLKEARRILLKERKLSPDWVSQPVIEHEALRAFAEENGWLAEAS